MKATLQRGFTVDLARRCLRAERTIFAVLALAVLVCSGTGAAPGHAYPPAPVAETTAFGWPL